MFLIRCAFWLAVVYASMFWGGGALRRHGAFEAAVADGTARAGAVTRSLADGVACGAGVERCAVAAVHAAAAARVADAASMTALVQTALRSDEGSEEIVRDADEVPAPQRRGAGALSRPR